MTKNRRLLQITVEFNIVLYHSGYHELVLEEELEEEDEDVEEEEEEEEE